MSKWKALSHSDGKFTVNKFNEWAPSHPFTIPYQGAKIKYSEGDEITDVTNPVFNIEFTGVPVSNQHNPCGYWHKNYIPPNVSIYTSLVYPVEDVDESLIGVSLIDGNFRSLVLYYEFEDYATLGISVYSGVFRSILQTLSINPENSTIELYLNSGIFRHALFSYSISNDNSNINVELYSGIFRRALIQYEYWPSESLNISINLIGGTHASS